MNEKDNAQRTEESVEIRSKRNGLEVSVEIVKARGEPHTIYIRAETLNPLQAYEGDIRQRISELLNKAIRSTEND